MKRKIMLPYEDRPFSLAYHGIAFSMGIIQANATQSIVPWLCGKYINCCFDDKEKRKFLYFDSDYWPIEDNILIKQRIDLYPDLFKTLFPDILKLFRDMISCGYYPHGQYNEQFVPGKWSFDKTYYRHNFLLIGYDDIEQVFISAGYLNDRHFHKYQIPYRCMKQALETVKNPRLGYNFWKYNEKAKFDLNLSKVLSELANYIEGVPSPNAINSNGYWGLKALKMLSYHFNDNANEGAFIDNRYTCALMEHKFYMKSRIEYLINNKVLKQETYLLSAQSVFQISESVHLLGIKYNLTKNQSVVGHMRDYISKIIEIEQNYLPLVWLDLKSYKGEMK